MPGDLLATDSEPSGSINRSPLLRIVSRFSPAGEYADVVVRQCEASAHKPTDRTRADNADPHEHKLKQRSTE